ncbi:MAG: EAL domain-containing protein [Clostridia bacterium]|nr:EAL domain-containing protein [Clostridia bacterium]
MSESYTQFHSGGDKRRILVVDDEVVNRELLGLVLEDEYEVHFAEDGKKALDAIRSMQKTLSLVILDLMMPGMDGLTLLERLKEDPDLARIPVIVMTSESAAEVESLRLGAIDFIPKPYPQPEVIRARALRTIELCEDRQIIQDTERDDVTGLYNTEYFYRYVQQYDLYHAEAEMDAVMVDINHFHLINERMGRAYGSLLLRRIGEGILGAIQNSGGIVCRRGGDVFLIYCPHREDYAEILDGASVALEDEGSGTRVRPRLGVYERVDKTIDIERRFDRAKQAADTIRNNYARQIAVYDIALHENELYAEQLTDDFQAAIREKQFRVFYQPKYDVQGARPMLASAEALVRWQHPELGMISPGTFIPLFETNGMIRELDRYVWRETAAQIRSWRDRFGVTLPVSVNVSRINMFDSDLCETLRSMLAEYGLDPRCLHLEITESAYTNDSQLIVNTVKQLRETGFKIEMDDFGAGYSSLGMLSRLPIDALKLDMMFVRNAFSDTRDVRMLKLIIDIADTLDVPVIAEGVETEEQMVSLKVMGCEMVQGYYFSKPLPPEGFERFIADPAGTAHKTQAEKRDADAGECAGREAEEADAEGANNARIARAFVKEYDIVYLVNTHTGGYVRYIDEEAGAAGLSARRGEDFFDECCREALKEIHPEDLAQALSVWNRDRLLSMLSSGQVPSVIYRIESEGQERFTNARVVRIMEDSGEEYVIIGVRNVDEQVRKDQARQRELEHAREAANRDPLTGVKSRRAFEEAGKLWDRRIALGKAEPFAVAVCDVNGLKYMNDTMGHVAGDELLQDASRIICNVFKHSPVYRFGGDEFSAILCGQDYENRRLLSAVLDGKVRENLNSGGTVIAYGISDFVFDQDKTFSDVFNRADDLMYERKKALKEQETRRRGH